MIIVLTFKPGTMKQNIRFLLLALIIAGLGTGCISLKHVNDFSASSAKRLATYSDLPYSYGQHCLDLCKLAQERGILTGTVPFNPAAVTACDCRRDKAKDVDAVKAYTTLILYFSGLEKLSAGDQFVYNTADLKS